MEVWLITEAPGIVLMSNKMNERRRHCMLFEMNLFFVIADQLPTPSYILCISYFFSWIGSVGLLVGLALVTNKYGNYIEHELLPRKFFFP